MFEKLTNVISKIKTITPNALALTVFILPDIKRLIIKLNQVDQLYTEGVDINDKVIGTYSYLTAVKTGQDHYIFNGLVSVKRAGEPYTLYDTGEFYESFKVVISNDGFTIEANTVKPDRDLMDYGPILGLTEESKEKLIEQMLPLLRKSLQQYLLS